MRILLASFPHFYLLFLSSLLTLLYSALLQDSECAFSRRQTPPVATIQGYTKLAENSYDALMNAIAQVLTLVLTLVLALGLA